MNELAQPSTEMSKVAQWSDSEVTDHGNSHFCSL